MLLRTGAMPAAEASGGLREPVEGAEHRSYQTALPVLSVIAAGIIGIPAPERWPGGGGAGG